MFAEVEVGLEPILDGRESQLVQPSCLGARELLVRELLERGAPPERKRVAEGAPGARRVAGRERDAALRDEALEARAVQLPRRQREDVARRACLDPAAGRERASQLGDVELEQLRGRGRRVAAPQRLDQRVGGDDQVRAQKQDREQRARLRPPQRFRAVCAGDFERAKNAELHRRLAALYRRSLAAARGRRARPCPCLVPCVHG